MSNERYPDDLVITPNDFSDCGWKDILTDIAHEGYPSMWQAFSAASKQAMEKGNQSQGKVLWLLADACSMMLSPKSTQEPFKPISIIDGKRSVIPDDLSEADIIFFSQIVDGVDDPFLKARLADLVWLKQQHRDVRFALTAIDAYRSIPLDREAWVRSGRECWERAISLALMLQDGAGERLKEMETRVINTLNSVTHQDGFLGLWLAELLEANRLGRREQLAIARKLESLANEFEDNGDVHRSRECFEASARWFKVAGDDVKFAEVTVAVAEGWVKEAVARISSDQPSHLVAASFYENAIQTYRTIPRSERAIHRVDERIAELRVHLSESGRKSLEEMSTSSTPGIDISQIIENARDSVRGKSAMEALKIFSSLHHGADVKVLRDNAIKRLQTHPLRSLFAATHRSSDGRVIAKRPAIDLNGTLSEDNEIVINVEMINDYRILISLLVQGSIWPALKVMIMEHRLRENDFINLAIHSPIVPNGREQLFGKALYTAYDGDFVTALHLLVPQVEHMVRYHLKQRGAKTTSLGIDGIENENGLSALMELPEVGRVFDDNLAFEIRALFCDAFGPNLRNELAHGLLDIDACQSIYSVYAWWLGLRIVFGAYWQANQMPETNSGK